MSKPVPRSRLNISYRTQIDGKPKKAKLPMRLLVLGDFTGSRAMLGDRPVHSILPGMKLGTFMEELKLTAPIDDPALGERLSGRLVGAVTGKLVRKLDPADTKGSVKFSGTGTVSGDVKRNGLGSFVGEVQISGEASVPVEAGALKFPDDGVEVELQLHGKVEPPAGADAGVTGNVDGKFKVRLLANDLNDNDTTIDLRSAANSDSVIVDLTIPIRSVNDFKPLNLAASVPEIRRLVLLHRLVLEARNYIASSPELREVVKAALAETKQQMTDKDAAIPAKDTRLVRLQSELRALYPQLVVS